MDTPDYTSFYAELRKGISGELLDDPLSRLLYSTDASLYQIQPLATLLPRRNRDVRHAIQTASRYKVPLLPRGGGTSLAGQTVTSGLVLDTSRHLNKVVEIDTENGWVRVQPGIVLDNLNEFLKSYGVFFAPDVATSSRANIGGMIGNNSCGVRSIIYGKTVDHVLELCVSLSNGERLRLKECTLAQLEQKCAQQDFEGKLYRDIRGIVERNRNEILTRYPRVMRRVGGYNLDALLDFEHFNLAKLIVGSEGTLGVVTEARLKTTKIPPYKVLAAVHFDQLLNAVGSVESILSYGPSAVEIMDGYGLRLARSNPAVARLCADFIRGDPEAVLLVEFSGFETSTVRQNLAQMEQNPRLKQDAYFIFEALEPGEQARVWEVRKNALGVLLSTKGDAKPLPFIEDAGIPVKHLRDYIEKVVHICGKHQRQVAMYAHASVGVIHVRPLLNLKQEEDVRILEDISGEVFDLVRHYGGAWSGEHGDGLVRSYKNREFFGDQLYEAFREVKKAFDPNGLMNPGKVVDSPAMTENLRIHPGYRTSFPETFYHFSEEQGLDRAVELCSGVGHCRKTLVGTMCPSYMATLDELHSTRGRANALRSAISGQLGTEGFTSPRLYDALDLCIECKACKSECPTTVDMAKLKAEFLAHYYTRHGTPLFAQVVARTRETASMASRLPGISNAFLGNRLVRWGLEKTMGVDQRRRLPKYAQKSLSALLADKSPQADEASKRVALFLDTFSNFYEPAGGLAAFSILTALGYRVMALESGCCGRPLISAGQLQAAQTRGQRLVQELTEQLGEEDDLIVLEPSCFATLRDDLPDLVANTAAARSLAERTFSLEEFLLKENELERLASLLNPGPEQILLHPHCQQKAIAGTEALQALLQCLPKGHTRLLDSACCGMAGSFGYQRQHHSLSRKIGELRLFPALRDAGEEVLVAAAGFSCRSQIAHFTNRRALHPLTVVAKCLKKNNV